MKRQLSPEEFSEHRKKAMKEIHGDNWFSNLKEEKEKTIKEIVIENIEQGKTCKEISQLYGFKLTSVQWYKNKFMGDKNGN